MNVVRMLQGSPEWHEHRRKYRNASETPVVLGKSPWATPYQLWAQKMGLIEPEVTPAMRHGSELEPAAREAYEARVGVVMQPLVVVAGNYSASLDGMTLAGDRILEIKCPVKGRDSTLWAAVSVGQLPECYKYQVQHQLMVTGAAVADVWVFDGSEGLLLQVNPDPSSWPRIRAGWDEFMAYVASRSPPPLTKDDVRERSDPDWLEAAAVYLETKLFTDQARRALEEAKERLVALTSHTRESGGGLVVTRFCRAGAIDYSKVAELAGIDLEPYRAAPKEEVRVALTP
jgi:putative phage-type endonuclease